MKIHSLVAIVSCYLVVTVFTSCATKKELIYLNGTTNTADAEFKWSEMYLQPNDIVSVKVTSDVPNGKYNLK